MRYSHHPGCPVALADLRYLRMGYVGFDGSRAHRRDGGAPRSTPPRSPTSSTGCTTPGGRSAGCAWSTTTEATTTGRWRRTTPRATTAAGSPARDAWSAHAYGAAIDINPVQNPYLTRSSVDPPGAEPVRGASTGPPRAASPGRDPGRTTSWSAPSPGSAGSGAGLAGPKDYQHFSALTR